jgi:diguanylate cyclase (GGDEF)-like protein
MVEERNKTKSTFGPFTFAHVLYTGLLGFASLALLIAVTLANPDLLTKPLSANPLGFVIMLFLAFVARLMSFRVAGMVTFTLDTGVYVASVMTLGVGAGVLLAFIAMLMRGVVELVQRELAQRAQWPFGVTIAKLFFGPSVTAVALLSTTIFVDFLGISATASEGLSFPSLALAFFVMTVTFVMLQYGIVVFGYFLNGLGVREIWKEVFLPGIVAECVFMPIGFALVVVYRNHDLPALLVLSLSYLLFAWVFRRQRRMSEEAREKAQELALVEEAGRAAASTLNIEEVGRRLGIILLDAIPDALGVVFTARGSSSSEKPFVYVRARERAMKPMVYDSVMNALGTGVLPDNTPTVPLDGKKTASGEVLARPLVAYDGSGAGYLCILMKPEAVAGVKERRLLQSLARQAAVAVENWRLYSLAMQDGLTGLFVRRYIENRLAEEVERARRSNSKFCFMMLDVDNLKEVNDKYGHSAGDMLLKRAATAIKQSIRAMDVAARWGGDEFAVLLPDMDLEGGMVVGQRILANLKALSFVVGGATIVPSASIGIGSFDGTTATTPAEIVGLADKALYLAKESPQKGGIVGRKAT